MRRRNRAGLKRIGLLALAMILALGAMGTAYSAWTEDLYIDSSIQLGNLDIDVAGVSSTFAYKVPGAPDTGFGPETVVHYVYGQTDPYPPSGGTLVASAVTVPDITPDADMATMTFSGVFPGIDFWADVELEYLGTIPAVINAAEISATNDPDNTLEALFQRGRDTKDDPVRTGAWIDGELSTDNGLTWAYTDDPIGMELQQFDLAHVTLHVHLPDEEEFQNISNLGFTGTITVIQWNEYEEP